MRMIHKVLSVAMSIALAGAPAMAQDHSHHHGTPQAGTPVPDPPQQAPEHDHAAMGHAPPATPATPAAPAPTGHAHHDHAGATPQAPREPIPALTDADRRAAFPDLPGHPAHDRTVVSFVQLDRLEAWDADQGAGQGWEALVWVGNDEHRLWLRSEGEREGGALDHANAEVFYGRPVSAWWDVLVGVRQDFGHGDPRTYAALGVVGLAPYKFEVSATAYLGESGHSAASLEAEYETLFTQRLVLQSNIEAELHGRDDPARDIGSGLSTVELGLRLRYEFTRRFAPYVGLAHERAFGRTADFRRHDGEGVEDTRIVAGVRIWF